MSFSFLSCTNLYECEHFRDYLDHEAHGTVTKKYLDSVKHVVPIIEYRTVTGKRGFSDIGRYIPAAYDTLEIGDILNKDSGSTMVTVTKKGLVIELDTAKETRRVWCQK